MKSINHRLGTILGFMFLFVLSIQAQESAEVKSEIQRLKEGLLIIRLDMQKNKIKAFEDVLAKSRLSEKEYMRTKDRLDDLISERKEYAENLKAAVLNKYHFSNYCFLESQLGSDFLNGDSSVLECPNQTNFKDLTEDDIFFLVKGDEDTHLILTDYDFRRLQTVPSSHNVGMARLVDIFRNRPNYHIVNMNKVFSSLNTKMEKHYAKQKSP